MERIFRAKLKKLLQEKIKGFISIHIYDDRLIIDIVERDYSQWHYTINNIAVQLSSGLSAKIVSDVIVKQYKKYILSRHFY